MAELRLDGVGDFLSVGAAEPGAGIPSGCGCEAAVIALGDIRQGCRIDIEVRIDKAGPAGLRRIYAREEAGPERRHCARPADDQIVVVDPHIVSGLRVGNAADIGYASHLKRLRPALGLGDVEPFLVGRSRKNAAYSATRRATSGAVVPYSLAGDGAAGALQIGAATGQAIRARSGKIGMIGSVADAVIRSIVTRCRAHRYSHRSGSLESLVESSHRLRGPGRFRAAPADRDYRRVVLGVVNRRGDRVKKSGIRIRREIDDDVGTRSYRPGALDIEHHLPVRSVGISRGMVFSMVHRYGGDFRLGDVQSGEVIFQVSGTVAAAELYDGDAFALPGSSGKTVQRGELRRRKRPHGSGRCVPSHIAVRRTGPKVRACLGSIVETEYGSNHTVQLIGQMDRSCPATVGAAIMLELLQVYPKRVVELSHRAG